MSAKASVDPPPQPDAGTSSNNVGASLARMRMFLAAHTPPASYGAATSDVGRCTPPPPPPKNEFRTESSPTHDDDLSGDISVLAEQFTESPDGHEQDGNGRVPASVEAKRPSTTGCDNKAPHALPGEERDHDIGAGIGEDTTMGSLNEKSEAFTRVRHLLQCSLPGYRVHADLTVWDMRNPSLLAQYEQQANGLLELDSWVPVDALSAAMSDSPEQGFKQTHDGRPRMKFTTGSIPMDPSAPGKQGKKQLVLCKIAVGRSVIVNSEEETQTKVLPPGYHSFIIQKPAANVPPLGTDMSDESIDDHAYCHEYILDNALQILPQWLVRFSFSALDTKTSSPCALCDKKPATLTCKSCDANLCASCDHEVHSANKLVGRHTRTQLSTTAAALKHARIRRRSSTPSMVVSQESEAPAYESNELSEEEINTIVAKQREEGLSSFQGTCKQHDGKRLEFFCPMCSIPICVNCKVLGDHSIGDKGSHRLLSIADAYEGTLRESLKLDPLVESRKAMINKKASSISRKKKEIIQNRDEIRISIQRQYDQAMQQLDAEVAKKTSVLDGEALEYQRQHEQIAWLEDSLDEQRSACSVIEFLHAWQQHKILRAEQRDFPSISHASVGDHVKANLQLLGRLEIVESDTYQPRKSLLTGDPARSSIEASLTSSPRSAAGDSTISMMRCTSDKDIRRRILSMKTVSYRDDSNKLALKNDVESPAPSLLTSTLPTATLSANGMQMMEEIRKNLTSKGTFGVRPKSGAISSSGPTRARMNVSNPTASLRAFSIRPMHKRIDDTMGAASFNQKRSSTDAWTMLLRQEMQASTIHLATDVITATNSNV